MRDEGLAASFNRHLRYRRARAWRKPLLDPLRFARNQAQKFGLHRHRIGQCRQVSTFHIPNFTIVNGEGVGEYLASYGIYEEDLTEGFMRLVRPGDVVLDIGMHLGYYEILFAQLV